jgi:hypothetical protein
MRVLGLFAIVSTGCVISAPEGKPQFWPPQLGGTVEAVVAGDLDANGSTDIVVMMTGNEHQAGFYLLDSDVDLAWESGTGDVLRSFSTFVPTELERPVAAYLDGAAAPRIYVATGSDTLEVIQLANNLTELDRGTTTVPGGGDAWIRPLTFPGGMVHYTVSNGAKIDHLDTTLGDPKPLPQPMGTPSWNLAQTATSYSDGANQVVAVATSTAVYRCTIPTTPGTPFDWTPVRTGEPWLGQTAFDFDGDGHDEILGYEAMAHRVCVVKVDAATLPVTPSCIELMTPPRGTDVTIIAGANLSQEPGADILVVQATGSETAYSIVKEVAYSNGALTSPMVPAPIPVMGPARGRTVIARPSPARPYSVLTFGTDGAVVCALGPC